MAMTKNQVEQLAEEAVRMAQRVIDQGYNSAPTTHTAVATLAAAILPVLVERTEWPKES